MAMATCAYVFYNGQHEGNLQIQHQSGCPRFYLDSMRKQNLP